MHLFADYHTHTHHSHGQGSVLDNARAAQMQGLAEVAIADHGPANLFGVGVGNLGVFGKIRKEVMAANAIVAGLRVLLAVEANVVGVRGELDIPMHMQKIFDLVLAGLHIMVRPRSWRDAAPVVAKNILARSVARRAALVANTDLLVAAVYSNSIDIITHPGYRLPVDTRELARACAATQTAMEINTSHPYTDRRYIREAARTGVRFAIGSDAHEPARVGDLIYGIELAREAGLEPEQVINARGAWRERGYRGEIPRRRSERRWQG